MSEHDHEKDGGSYGEFTTEFDDDRDDRLPADQLRRCGGCGEAFLSEVQRSKPTFVPLFCPACDAALGEPPPIDFSRPG